MSTQELNNPANKPLQDRIAQAIIRQLELELDGGRLDLGNVTDMLAKLLAVYMGMSDTYRLDTTDGNIVFTATRELRTRPSTRDILQ